VSPRISGALIAKTGFKDGSTYFFEKKAFFSSFICTDPNELKRREYPEICGDVNFC
jgi:hypothetical protein